MGGGFSRPYERPATLAEKLVVALESPWWGAVLAARMRDFQSSNTSIVTARAKRSPAGQEEGGRFQPPV